MLHRRLTISVGLALISGSAAAMAADPPPLSPTAQQQARTLNALPPVTPPPVAHPPMDHSGRSQQGKASYYAGRFSGRTMADGRTFNPNANVAASKSLPLGTTAKVIDLATGKTAVVSVEDTGPHVGGRMLDVSPKVATTLGMGKSGVARVVVKPIAVPQPDGGMKLGAGAAEARPQQVREAVRTAQDLAPSGAN